MPTKPRSPKTPQPRNYPRVSITMDPDTRERFDRIRAAKPELESLSAAIRWAGRAAEERLEKSRRQEQQR